MAPRGRIVIGFHSVEEVICTRPHAIQSFWFCADMISVDKISSLVKQIKFTPTSVARSFLDKLGSHHQGLGVEVNETPEWRGVTKENSTLIYLDEVQDPHNLGAILRSAWIFGVEGIFVPERRSAQLTPTVSRIASGGAEHVPIEPVTSGSQFVEKLKSEDFWVYGLSEDAKLSLETVRFPERTVFAVGGEEKGIGKTIGNVCDEWIRIPRLSERGDLNASVAAAIVLYERARQQRESVGK